MSFLLSYFLQFNAWGLWFLQFAVGVIFIVHGWPKTKKMSNFFGIGGGLHGLIEVIGGAALIFGFYVREVALVFSLIMLGAIYFKRFKWNIPFSSHTATGWEFDLILLAASIFLLVR